MSELDHDAHIDSLERLEFQPTCVTKSGCGQPVFAYVRISFPCAHKNIIWQLCEAHLTRLLTDTKTYRWRCKLTGETYMRSLAELPKQIVGGA